MHTKTTITTTTTTTAANNSNSNTYSPATTTTAAAAASQKPRQSSDNSLVIEPAYDEHLRHRTSFVAPEIAVAAEMVKAPQLLREQKGGLRAATGASILEWLSNRRNLPADAALAYAQRMVVLGLLQPLGDVKGAPAFSGSEKALFRIQAAMKQSIS